MATSIPIFRAEIVGSLLRPPALHEARAERARGAISPEALRTIESEHIEAAVALQREAGLGVCTDGEFHRRHWFMDFMERIDGIEFRGGMPVKFHNETGAIEFSPPRLQVGGKLARSRSLAVHDFTELLPIATRAGLVAKQAIPSPTIVHFRGGRAAIDAEAYPDMDQFFADLARVYREEVAALYAAGCRYLQIDETNLPYMCDPKPARPRAQHRRGPGGAAPALCQSLERDRCATGRRTSRSACTCAAAIT